MDIVDTQVHLNMIGTEPGLVAMDAVGVTALLFDEGTKLDERGNVLPGHGLANGAFRPVCPEAEAAALRHPDRVGVLRRVDYRDPDLDSVVKLMAATPYVTALRVFLYAEAELAAFAKGDYAGLFAIADRYGMPVCVFIPGRADLLQLYAEKFPDLNLVVDHCGVPLLRGGQAGQLDTVLGLARYRNVFLKWAHAPMVFSAEPYPFGDVIPLLKRALSAFGRERIMWASDFTQTAMLYSWAEALFYLRDSAELSADDKEWILARTARAVFNWPKAPRSVST